MRHSKQRVLLLGLSLLIASPAARAQRVSATTGNSLLELCESKDVSEQAFCLGYVVGATDVDSMDGAAFPERRRSCAPDNVTNGQQRDIVVKYLKEHPEERHILAAILVVKAMAKAFPCKS
jgi:hypothetical protein